MKPRGAIAHQRHMRYAVKKKISDRDLNQDSNCLCCCLLPSQTHPHPLTAPAHQPQSLQWPACDHAESENYCVVDNLLTTAVYLMYRVVVCCGVS